MPGRLIKYAASIALLTTPAAAASSDDTLPPGIELGRCKVDVGNSARSSKSCGYEMSDDGSFELWPDPPSNYYVAVHRINGDTAEAYTNGGKELGKVKRQGACWVNRRARICLWRN